MIEYRSLTHGEMEEAIAKCGVPLSKARISFDELLQSDVVTIDRLAEHPSRDLLLCLFEVTYSAGYHVEFAEEGQQAAYAEISGERQQVLGRELAQNWLRKRGLLDKIPVYDPNSQSPIDYARVVEAFCGLEPGAAIEQFNESLLVFRPEFASLAIEDRTGELSRKLTCVMQALAASNLDEEGIRVGIIGGGAAVGEDNR